MPPDDHWEWLIGGQLATVHRWIENGDLQYRLPEQCSIRHLLEIDFPSARECRTCHPTQYEQWSRSMHAYAQHSPIFEAFNLTLMEYPDGTIGKFCTRCYTPIGTALGENGSRCNVNRFVDFDGRHHVCCLSSCQTAVKQSKFASHDSAGSSAPGLHVRTV